MGDYVRDSVFSILRRRNGELVGCLGDLLGGPEDALGMLGEPVGVARALLCAPQRLPRVVFLDRVVDAAVAFAAVPESVGARDDLLGAVADFRGYYSDWVSSVGGRVERGRRGAVARWAS